MKKGILLCFCLKKRLRTLVLVLIGFFGFASSIYSNGAANGNVAAIMQINGGTKTSYMVYSNWNNDSFCDFYKFSSATTFSGVSLGHTTALVLNGLTIDGWTDNGDFVSGQVEYRIWLKSGSRPGSATGTFNVGGYGSACSVQDVQCSSGNNRRVGWDGSSVDLLSGLTPGDYNFEIISHGQMRYNCGYYNQVDNTPVTATFTVDPVVDISVADFRSAATGPANWSTASSWQYNSTGSTWLTATQVPGAGNNVTIQAGHTINLDVSPTFGSGKTLTVSGTLSAGAYNISGAGNFTLTGTLNTANSSGILGTIQTSGSNTFTSGSITFNAGGSQNFGASTFSLTSMDINVTGTSTNVTLDNSPTIKSLTIGSGSTFTASDASPRALTIAKLASGTSTTVTNNGTWANGTGGSTVVFTGAPSSGDAIHAILGAIAFQNITINKTSGTSNVGASFGANSSLTGTLEIGTGGFISTDPPTGFYSTNAILKFNQGTSATYNVNSGDKTWSTTVIPNNITISSGTVSLNDSRTAIGNLVIDGGTLNLAANLTINGNWILTSGLFTPNNYTITLSGATDGNVNATGSASMYNAVIDKTSGAAVNLLSSLTVTNTLTINAGSKLTLGSGNTLTVETFDINSDATNGTGTFVDSNTGGGLTVIGTTSVQQYLTAGRNWYISSPVASAASTIVTGSSAGSLWSYAEPTVSWVTTDASFVPTKGYIANMLSDGPVTFTGGTLNTGDITTPTLSRTGITETGFNLIGNPYPSYASWDDATKNKVLTSIWYRSKSTGTYIFQTYNSTGHVGTLGGSELIPPMQSFWVRTDATQPGDASVTFKNGTRSHQNQSITNNRLKAPAATNTTQQVLRLQVSNGVTNDEAIVLFNPNALDGFDMYDSHKMSNNDAAIPEIYTLAGTEQVAINGLNSLTADEVLPLGFTTGTSNVFSIKASEVSNFDANTKIVLKDNLLNTEQDLTDGTAYSFTSDVASTTNRFSLVFKSVGVTTGVQTASGNQSILIYKNANNQIEVNCTGSISDNAYVSVYNTLGRKLESKQMTGTTTVIGRTFTSGVYVVTVNNGGKSIIKKVILN